MPNDGVIMQINPTTDQLHVRAALSMDPDAVKDKDAKKEFVHPATALAQALIEEEGGERTFLVPDLRQNKFWDPRAVDYQCALAVLLEINDDILGVMMLFAEEQDVFNDAHVRLALAAANQVAAAINNSDLYYLIRDQAERLGVLVLAEQQEAQKSNSILEGIADGVMLADAESKMIRFNSAAERILNLSHQRCHRPAAVAASWVCRMSAWMPVIEHWRHSAEHDPVGGFLSEQLELGPMVVNVRLSPVRTKDQFLGTVLVFRDITKEFEADRLKSEFISNVSHELRTPMTSIKGYADLLALGAVGPLTDQQKDFIRKIKSNADRLEHSGG